MFKTSWFWAFRRFPRIFRRFPRIFRRFPRIFRRFPRISGGQICRICHKMGAEHEICSFRVDFGNSVQLAK